MSFAIICAPISACISLLHPTMTVRPVPNTELAVAVSVLRDTTAGKLAGAARPCMAIA